MFDIYKNYRKEHPRLTNNIILTVVSLLGCLVALGLALPTQSLLEALAVGTGYVGLGLLAVTLLIGPINMLKVRKNPVNLNFRRDAGIWAGIMSLLHVVLAFALEINWGGTLLGYFLYKDGSIKLSLFGISNYIGLAATLILIFLMVLSNNHFLKTLKGKKWKNLQRFNYLLFALVLGHTFTQQVNNVRGLWMVIGAVLVTAAVMVGQSIGFRLYRKREQERKVAPVVKPVPAKVAAATTTAPATPATVPAAKVTAPVQPVPAIGGFSKLKVASAVGLLAMLGVGAGLEGINLLNSPVTAQTSETTTNTGTTDTSSTATNATATTTAATSTTATTAAASSSSTTTVSNASSRSGSAHTGGS